MTPRRILALLAGAAVLTLTAGCGSGGGTATAAPVVAAPTTYQPLFPIDAAFYYPWFPEAWKQQGYNPFTNYHPSPGYYDSSKTSVIAEQIQAMQWAGMDAGIASWWGQGSRTDQRVGLLLRAATNTRFRWALYYEKEGNSNPTVGQLRADLTYIRTHYASSPAYLRVHGKPVIFAYGGAGDACGMASRWAQANTVGFYVVLKVFPGYASCAHQPQGWHQYAPAQPLVTERSFSVSISPGFWKKGESVRLARNLARWRQDVAALRASHARFRLVTTFNEWGEGTAVESAREWASRSGYGRYLDVLHQMLGSHR